MKILAALILPAVLLAQDVTVRRTEPALAKAFLERPPRGIELLSVIVCGPFSASIPAGAVAKAAAAQGFTVYPASAVDELTQRATARSWAQRASDVAEGLTLSGAALTAEHVIAAGSIWTTALILAAGAAHWFAAKLQPLAPDPEKLKALALPDPINLPVGGCWTGISIGSEGTK